MARRTLVFTEQLHKDLARIHRFIGDERFDAFIPLLKASVERLVTRPGLGRPFRGARASPRARALIHHVGRRLGTDDLRELVSDEHVVLHAVTASRVSLLAIRNQLEGGFHVG